MAEQLGITTATVEHLAHLAQISLNEEEKTVFTQQLSQILGAIAKISEVAGADVPPTSHPVPLANVTRPDEIYDVLTQEQALLNAPDSAEGKFQVTAILGEEQ